MKHNITVVLLVILCAVSAVFISSITMSRSQAYHILATQGTIWAEEGSMIYYISSNPTTDQLRALAQLSTVYTDITLKITE